MGGAPDEPAPHALPQPLSESGGGGSDESPSELERDMQLAFDEQEKSSPPPAEPEYDRGRPNCRRSEELGRGPPLRSQDGGEGAQEQQQRQEVAVELMREDDGGDGDEPEERGAKWRHPDKTHIGSDIHHPEASNCSHDTGDEDDEDPRPTKRQRLPSTDNALTLPHEPAPIENETIYNLEFQLPHVLEHLYSEASGIRSNKKTSAEATNPHNASAHSKMYPAAVRPRIKRVRWTPEEDATILKMREKDGCSWEEIAKALPYRTPEAI
ncbi:hypothetical protein DL98DRAFT_599974 [Cadophora sp. DSE1049]|nr:hypothetical protein DL98DRAFT_599974 [Cadophora sp. DSE1049]